MKSKEKPAEPCGAFFGKKFSPQENSKERGEQRVEKHKEFASPEKSKDAEQNLCGVKEGGMGFGGMRVAAENIRIPEGKIPALYFFSREALSRMKQAKEVVMTKSVR